MTRYHISASGGVAVCKARLRCRLGGDHYISKAEALMHAPAPSYKVKGIYRSGRNNEASFEASGRSLPRERMVENEQYAQFLRKFEAKNGQSAASVYRSYAGAPVTRSKMIEEMKQRFKAPALTSAINDENDHFINLKNAIYEADAAALREKKERFRAAYDAYRVENGPATRPNFQRLMADNEAKRARITSNREEAKSTRQKLSQVQSSKRLRNSQEDVAFSFIFGEQVAIGEDVTESKESIFDFFGESGDSFHRS